MEQSNIPSEKTSKDVDEVQNTQNYNKEEGYQGKVRYWNNFK
jgi:hypothetical protein